MARPRKAEGDATGFAQRLKSLREAADLTQATLAERAGLNRFGVAKLEQGVTEPNWPTVLRLAGALGVDVSAFVVDVPADGEKAEPIAPEPKRGRPRKAPGQPQAPQAPQAPKGSRQRKKGEGG